MDGYLNTPWAEVGVINFLNETINSSVMLWFRFNAKFVELRALCLLTCQFLVDCVIGAADRGSVPEDRLYVRGSHYLGRVLYIHAAGVRWDVRLVRTCPPGRLPSPSQDESDAAPRPDPANSGHATWWLVHLLQSGRTNHVVVARHATSPLQVHRGQCMATCFFS